MPRHAWMKGKKLATEDEQGADSTFHYENGVPVFDTDARLKEVEREQEAAKKRDEYYKTEQLRIDRRVMWFTGMLVLCTAATGGISSSSSLGGSATRRST